jgi:hypothetical protein
VNVLQILAIVGVWLLAPRIAPRSRLPRFFTRRKIVGVSIPTWALGIVALLVALQTLSIPLLSDDHLWVERARRANNIFDMAAVDELRIGKLYRPAVWMQWWVFEKITPDSALAGRCVSILWFVAQAILLVPALRRCGVGRDTAILTSFLFTANPTAITTIGWLSNLYNQCSLTFALAALASMPVWRPSLPRSCTVGIFALLSFLSKEDTLLLPIFAALVGARFRWAYFRHGLVLAIPFGVALLLSLAIRFHSLGVVGGHDESSASMTNASAWLIGVRHAVTHEFPSKYWVPARESVLEQVPAMFRQALAAAPLFVIGALLLVRHARHVILLAAAIIVFPLVPVGSILDLTDSLLAIRLAYFSSVGFMLLWAAGIVGLSRWRWVAAIAIVASLAAFLWIGHKNLDSYRAAGEINENCIAIASRASIDAPPGGFVALGVLPENCDLDGVYSSSGVLPFAIARRSGQPNVVAWPAVGEFTDYLELDRSRRTLVRPLAATPQFMFAGDKPLTVRFGEGINFVVANGTRYPAENSGYEVLATSRLTVVRFPTFTLPPREKLDFVLDGGFPASRPNLRLRWFATILRNDGKILRVDVNNNPGNAAGIATANGGSLTIPSGARAAQLEAHVPEGLGLTIRGLRLECPPQ